MPIEPIALDVTLRQREAVRRSRELPAEEIANLRPVDPLANEEAEEQERGLIVQAPGTVTEAVLEDFWYNDEEIARFENEARLFNEVEPVELPAQSNAIEQFIQAEKIVIIGSLVLDIQV